MADLKITRISEETIALLDDLVIRQGYADRSALIRDILQKYVVFGNQMFVDQLPDMTRTLVQDALREYPEKLNRLLTFELQQQEETRTVLRKISAAFDEV